MKKLILSLILGVFLVVGCKPLKETVYVDRWHETTKIDSVYQFQKDTMFLQQKGDTIFVNKFSTKIDYKYKYITKTDTVTNTETKIKTKTVYVDKVKKETRWISYVDWILIIIFALYMILRFRKKLTSFF